MFAIQNTWNSFDSLARQAVQKIPWRAIPVAQSTISCVGAYLVSSLSGEFGLALTAASLGSAFLIDWIQGKRADAFMGEVQKWVDRGMGLESARLMAKTPLSDTEKDLFVSIFEKYPLTVGSCLHLPLAIALFDAYKASKIKINFSPFYPRIEVAKSDFLYFFSYFSIFDYELYTDLLGPQWKTEMRNCFFKTLQNISNQIKGHAELERMDAIVQLWMKLVPSESYEELFFGNVDFEVSYKGGIKEIRTSLQCLNQMYFEDLKNYSKFVIPRAMCANHPSFNRFMEVISSTINNAAKGTTCELTYLSHFTLLLSMIRLNFARSHFYPRLDQKEWEMNGCYRILDNMNLARETLQSQSGFFSNVYRHFLRNNRSFLPRLDDFFERLEDFSSLRAKARMILLNACEVLWGDLEKSLQVIEEQIKKLHRMENPTSGYREDLKKFFAFYLLLTDLKRLQKGEFSEDPLKEIPDRILDLLRSLKKKSPASSDDGDVTETETISSSSASYPRAKHSSPSFPKSAKKKSPDHEIELDEKEFLTTTNVPSLPRRHRDLEKILVEEFGFRLERQKGSHRTFEHPEGFSTTLSAHHGDDLYSKRAIHKIKQLLRRLLNQ